MEALLRNIKKIDILTRCKTYLLTVSGIKGEIIRINIIRKIKMTDELYETIIQALAIQSQSKDWTKENGQYVPNGSTWLNGKRWEDEVKQSSQSRHNGFSTTDYLAGVELDEFGQATI